MKEVTRNLDILRQFETREGKDEDNKWKEAMTGGEGKETVGQWVADEDSDEDDEDEDANDRKRRCLSSTKMNETITLS